MNSRAKHNGVNPNQNKLPNSERAYFQMQHADMSNWQPLPNDTRASQA